MFYVYLLQCICALFIGVFKKCTYAYVNSNHPVAFRTLPIRNVKLKGSNENQKPNIDPDIIRYFQNVRREFPFFKREQYPVYFDNAATTHKPNTVIERINKFYREENTNIHRGIYKLSTNSTRQFEQVRDIIKAYIKCDSREEIIFTSGATHGFNMICEMMMDKIIQKKEDEILITYLEHHSNIIPWQEKIKKYKKGTLKYIPLSKYGFINIKKLEKQINTNTKVISFSHVSNVIGNIQNMKKIIKKAKIKNPNIIIIVDAAQSFPHMKYNLRKLKKSKGNPDVLIVSSHKCYGPLGTGFLYINKKLTDTYQFKPFLYGGNIITDVSKFSSKFVPPPHLFETGTPNIANVLSLGTTMEFLQKLNWKYLSKYEMYLYDLLIYYIKKNMGNSFVQLPRRKIISSTKLYEKISDEEKKGMDPHKLCQNEETEASASACNTISSTDPSDFILYGHNVRRLGYKKVGILPLWSTHFSSFDMATFLDYHHICIRAGNHCSALVHKYFLKQPDTARISISFYNTPEEILHLATHVATVSKMLSKMKQ